MTVGGRGRARVCDPLRARHGASGEATASCVSRTAGEVNRSSPAEIKTTPALSSAAGTVTDWTVDPFNQITICQAVCFQASTEWRKPPGAVCLLELRGAGLDQVIKPPRYFIVIGQLCFEGA